MNTKTIVAAILYAGATNHDGEDRLTWSLDTADNLLLRTGEAAAAITVAAGKEHQANAEGEKSGKSK